MKYKKFTEPKAGEWVQPIMKGYLLACCDCGLVHRMDFKIIKSLFKKRMVEKVLFRVERARNYTAQMRKKNGITVK